jgi:hypothetical protein
MSGGRISYRRRLVGHLAKASPAPNNRDNPSLAHPLVSRNKHPVSIPTDHPFDFDPTYGLGLDELRAMRPPLAPPGFDEFWRARYVGALSVNPQPRLRTSGSSHPNWRASMTSSIPRPMNFRSAAGCCCREREW